LSYIGPPPRPGHVAASARQALRALETLDYSSGLPRRNSIREATERSLERETGIEPATNSLEGCDSTTELLPPSRLACFARSPLRRAGPLLPLTPSTYRPTLACHPEPTPPRSHSPASSRGRTLVARGGLAPSQPPARQTF